MPKRERRPISGTRSWRPSGAWSGGSGPGSVLKPEGPVGALLPGRDPVGEDRHHLAADDADLVGALGREGGDQLREPVRLDQDVVVHQHDEVAPASSIARLRPKSRPWRVSRMRRGAGRRGHERGDDVARVVRRVVVDDEELPAVGRIILAHDAGKRLPQVAERLYVMTATVTRRVGIYLWERPRMSSI
jgi:hypothetical protein